MPTFKMLIKKQDEILYLRITKSLSSITLRLPSVKRFVRRRWTPRGGSDRLRNPFAFTPTGQDVAFLYEKLELSLFYK